MSSARRFSLGERKSGGTSRLGAFESGESEASNGKSESSGGGLSDVFEPGMNAILLEASKGEKFEKLIGAIKRIYGVGRKPFNAKERLHHRGHRGTRRKNKSSLGMTGGLEM